MFKGGRPDGDLTDYFADGTIARKACYVDGNLEGKHITYFHNSEIQQYEIIQERETSWNGTIF